MPNIRGIGSDDYFIRWSRQSLFNHVLQIVLRTVASQFGTTMALLTCMASSVLPVARHHRGLSGMRYQISTAHSHAGIDAKAVNMRQPIVGMMTHPLSALYMDPTIQQPASNAMKRPLCSATWSFTQESTSCTASISAINDRPKAVAHKEYSTETR